MPKHGDSTGLIHFNEIIGTHPVVWDDEPTYFVVPTQEMVAPAKKGKYFAVPAQPVQQVSPAKKATYFNVPAQATKRNVYFQIPSNNGDK